MGESGTAKTATLYALPENQLTTSCIMSDVLTARFQAKLGHNSRGAGGGSAVVKDAAI